MLKQILWVLMSERYVCALVPASAASNSLNFFRSGDDARIYSLVEHGLTYVEIVFDRSFVSHPFLMPRLVEFT